MNLSKRFGSTSKLLLILMVVTGVLLASCSPQVVEVEKEEVVTQVVKEEVVVEKEVEVEVVKEVEVSKVEYVEVEVEAEAEPRAPVTFTYAHNGPIRTMDAPVTWYGSTHWLTNTIYECLIWRNWDLSGYHGQAAESWEALDDTTWRFNLRPGITFHNGEPLDAEAVKWNLDRVMTREDFLVHPQWQFISEVKIVDDVTVDIMTGAPEAYFEYVVSYNGCELLPPDYMAEVGEEEFAKSPVGSGPYQLIEFTESDRYHMEAWDDYWGGRPDVDTIIYQVIPDSATQVQAMITGDVDMMAKVPEPDRIKLASTAGIDLLLAPMNRMHHLYLRADTEPGTMDEVYPDYQPVTLDPLVRQAVSHALDRSTLASVQGAAVPNLVRVCAGYPEGFADKYYGEAAADAEFDPDAAKQLLIDAGYDPDGGNKPKVYFESLTNQYGNEKEVAEVAALMLQDVGFDVELTVMDNSAYSEQIQGPGANRDIMLTTLGCGPAMTPLFYQCDWPGKNNGQCVPEWDANSDQIMQTVDSAARLDLWADWQEYYLEWGGDVVLYEMQNVIAINSDFEWDARKDGWMTFRDLKVAK